MAKPVTIKIKSQNMAEIRRGLLADAEGVSLALRAGLKNMAEDISNESEQLVPVDEGILRTSRSIDETNIGTTYQIEVGYGNSATPYALVQHERLDFWHPPKPPAKSKVGGRQGTAPGIDPTTGRGPKYLERPFKKYTANFAETLTAYVRKHYQLGTGRGS